MNRLFFEREAAPPPPESAAAGPPGVVLSGYQEDAVEAVMARFEKKACVLVQAPTAAGKPFIFAELARRYMELDPGLKIGIAAHRQVLVSQAAEKMEKVWPGSYEIVGRACAGLDRVVEVDKPLVIGSVQTMARRAMERPFDLLIIDECHHLPHLERGGQYYGLIEASRAANPCLRVLGVTATPYRLGHWFIYGDRCRPRETNFFQTLDFSEHPLIGPGNSDDVGFLRFDDRARR